MASVTERCICGENGGDEFVHLGLAMLRCPCGVERQRVEYDAAELAGWYATEYLDGVYYHSPEQDRKVAQLRLQAYNFRRPVRLLDVGAANGAFVEAANAGGHDAWGQDLAEQSESPRVYVGALEEISFPPGSFDAVTCHDVLEHVPNPVAFLGEIARILEPGGRFLLDFPRFHHSSGEHHWKPIEHLWMLNQSQLVGLVESCGFEVVKVSHPVPSKIVLDCRNRHEWSDVSILVPPGIGDGYWVAAKLPAFLEREGLLFPEVFVHDSGPRRAGGLWESLPFVRFGGYRQIDRGPAWDAAYNPPGAAVQTDVQGLDYFLSFNGVLDGGRSLDDALPGKTEWYPRLFLSKDRKRARRYFAEAMAPYVAVAFWDRGFYGKSYLPHFNEAQIVGTLRRLADSGLRVVVMGATFDQGGIASRLAAADRRFVDLVGDTSFDELVGLVESAAAVFGFPAGNTLLGPPLRVPTVLMWGDHFPRAFRQNVAPPDATYISLDVRGARDRDVAAEVLGVAR